jgi:hypothetical protein
MDNKRMVCRYPEGSSDEPSCPKCGNPNAMLHDSSELKRLQKLFKNTDFRKCRDCGALAVRID